MASAHVHARCALLKRARLAAGLTQEELAQRSGVSVHTISDLERGLARHSRAATLSLLADVLSLGADERAAFTAVERSVAPPRWHPPTHAPRPWSGVTRPPLVGRAREVARLEEHLAGVGAGPPLLLVAGEPGIGKTRLLQEASEHAGQAGWCVVAGGCTRRSEQEPYAPLLGALARHLAGHSPAQLRELLRDCAWLVRLLPELAEVTLVPQSEGTATPEHEQRLMFAAVGRYLAKAAGPAGTLLLLDDLQWMGADALKLLASLLHPAPTALSAPISTAPLRIIAAYRSTEVQVGDPLVTLQGDLAREGLVESLALGPLAPSEARVLLHDLLAHATAPGDGRDGQPNPMQASEQVERLVQRTGGVPFFLVSCAQEVRSGIFAEQGATEAGRVPWPVAQTIRQRMAMLPTAAREILLVAAVLGRSVPGPLLIQVLRWPEEEILTGLEHACRARLLVEVEEDAYQVSHDLIQEVVVGELTSRRRKTLHQRIAEALEATPGELPIELLAYHYERSEHREKAIFYLERAGERAAAVYAHTEAAQHYRMALRSAEILDVEHRARLLERLSEACRLTSQLVEAIHSQEAALAIWQAAEQQTRVGHCWRELSRLHWLLGHRAEADQCADQAIAVLRGLPPSIELARALSNKAYIAMLRDDDTTAVRWGTRAIVLAEQLGHIETLSYALGTIGAVEIFAGNERGRAKLERSVQLAQEHGLHEYVAQATGGLAEHAVAVRDYPRATQYLADGLSYCQAHDIVIERLFMRAIRARARLDQGDWTRAEEDAQAVLVEAGGAQAMVAGRIPALVVLGYVRARRGDPNVWAVLDEAYNLARTLNEPNRLMLVAAARAEAAWLAGQVDWCRAEAQVGFDLEPPGRGISWCFGELAFWLWRSGGLAEAPRTAAEPFARHIAGDWRAAATVWERIGCPYERAMALADGDELAQRAALSLFEGLGAEPAAERARQSVRLA